jgi:hypothetical protein
MMVNQLILYCSYWKKDEISECSTSSDQSIGSIIAQQLSSDSADSPSFSLTIPLDDENGTVTCLECFVDKDMFTNGDVFDKIDVSKTSNVSNDETTEMSHNQFIHQVSNDENDKMQVSSSIAERMAGPFENSKVAMNNRNISKNRKRLNMKALSKEKLTDMDTQFETSKEHNFEPSVCSKLEDIKNELDGSTDIVKLSEELSKITQDSISIVTEITKDLEALSADIYLEDKQAMDELLEDTPKESRKQMEVSTLNEDTPKENRKQTEPVYMLLEDTPEASRKLKQDDFALLEETPKEIRRQTELNVLNEDTPKENRKQIGAGIIQTKGAESNDPKKDDDATIIIMKESHSTVKEINIENEMEKAELIVENIIEPKKPTTSVVAHKLSVGCCEEIATMVDTIRQEIASFRGFEESVDNN